ncbi:MAG: hypothetical protein WEB88_15630 [Gemmatimonadota bacterium]
MRFVQDASGLSQAEKEGGFAASPRGGAHALAQGDGPCLFGELFDAEESTVDRTSQQFVPAGRGAALQKRRHAEGGYGRNIMERIVLWRERQQ